MVVIPDYATLKKMTEQLRGLLTAKRFEYQIAQAQIEEVANGSDVLPELTQSTPLADAIQFLKTEIKICNLRVEARQRFRFFQGVEKFRPEEVANKLLSAKPIGSASHSETLKLAICKYYDSLDSLRHNLSTAETLTEDMLTLMERRLRDLEMFLGEKDEDRGPGRRKLYDGCATVFMKYDHVQSLQSELQSAKDRNDLNAVIRIEDDVEEQLTQIENAFRGLSFRGPNKTVEQFCGWLHWYILDQQKDLADFGVILPDRQTFITSYFDPL
jgi:hypothetical protein